MQPTMLKDRPPFVRFEVKAEEDRTASIATGCYTERDVDYALITPAGSKDCTEQKAEEWLARLRDEVRKERFPAEWLAKYTESYKLWKSGQELPLHGTAIKTWRLLSPAQCTNLIALNIRTVEDLAVANEEVITRLGMGGRALRDKAREWLASEGGDAGKQAEKIVALQVAKDASDKVVEELKAQLAAVQAQLATLQPAAKVK